MSSEKWIHKKLGEVCTIHGRIGFRGYTTDDLVEKGYGAITFSPSDIHDSKLCYDNCDYISWFKYEESPEIKVFNGDILFCKTASIGKCAIVENLKEKATINPQFVVLKDFTCDSKYLYYKLISYDFQTHVLGITGGSTIKTMSQEKLGLEPISFPALPDGSPDIAAQRRIAAILSSADKVIASTQKVIAKYKQMKQGMMEELLKPKEGWKMVRLGEVINDSYAGGTPNRSRDDYFGGGIPWVTSGEVNNPEISSTLENITIEGLNNSSAKWIPENSILVALYGATAGQVSMLRIKATSNQAVLAVIPNADVADTMFLFYQIIYNKDNLLYLAQGSGQPNLSKNLVDSLEISIPNLAEQRRIAAILSGIDAKIAAEEKVLEKYEKVKKGMMERLLEGKS